MTRTFELAILGDQGYLECAWTADPIPLADDPGSNRSAVYNGAVHLDYDLLLEMQSMAQKREEEAQVFVVTHLVFLWILDYFQADGVGKTL